MIPDRKITKNEIKKFVLNYINNTSKQHGTNSKFMTMEFFDITYKIKLSEKETKQFHGVAIRIGKVLKEIESLYPNIVHKISKRTYLIYPTKDVISID